MPRPWRATIQVSVANLRWDKHLQSKLLHGCPPACRAVVILVSCQVTGDKHLQSKLLHGCPPACRAVVILVSCQVTGDKHLQSKLLHTCPPACRAQFTKPVAKWLGHFNQCLLVDLETNQPLTHGKRHRTHAEAIWKKQQRNLIVSLEKKLVIIMSDSITKGQWWELLMFSLLLTRTSGNEPHWGNLKKTRQIWEIS